MHSNNLLSINKYLSKCPQLLLFMALVSSAVMTTSEEAQAMNFDFTYEPGTSLEQMLGFEMAGEIWSSYLDDDITVNIHVGVTNLLPHNVIGGALPGLKPYQNYGTFYDKLYDDRTFSDDRTFYDDHTAHSNLHSYGYGSSRYYKAELETTSAWQSNKILLTRANAKAIDMESSHNSALDGLILMSDLSGHSNINWNYDYKRQNYASSNSVDFLSVAMHEIGHVLGFVSGVDSTKYDSRNTSSSNNWERLDHTTSLDQFRYTGSSRSRNNLDLAYGVDSYFSIDGGNTNLAYMSEGKDELLGYGGDGFQASHWTKNSNPLGIMDPDIALGERGNISDLDLRAFDVIGYDCKNFNSGSYSSSSWGYSFSGSSSSSSTCDASSLNLGSLKIQAQWELVTEMANEFGWSSYDASWIDWYINNGYNYTAASWISEERIDDVVDMIIDSQMYEWGWGDDDDDDGCNPNCNYPIELAQMLASEGMFEEFSRSTIQLQPEEVPESGVTLGLLGMGLLGFVNQLKRYRRLPAKV